MTALVGIAAPDRKADLQAMLQQLSYRGIIDYIAPLQNATVGMVFSDPARPTTNESDLLSAKAGPGHFARAQIETGGISLSRDPSGVCPFITAAMRTASFILPAKSKPSCRLPTM